MLNVPKLAYKHTILRQADFDFVWEILRTSFVDAMALSNRLHKKQNIYMKKTTLLFISALMMLLVQGCFEKKSPATQTKEQPKPAVAIVKVEQKAQELLAQRERAALNA